MKYVAVLGYGTVGGGVVDRVRPYKENVEPVCRPFHDVKALALPCLSKRATPKAPL